MPPNGNNILDTSVDSASRHWGCVSQSQSYVQAGTYLADGSPNVVNLGNGIQETIAENNRLQVQSMTVSTPLHPLVVTRFSPTPIAIAIA